MIGSGERRSGRDGESFCRFSPVVPVVCGDASECGDCFFDRLRTRTGEYAEATTRIMLGRLSIGGGDSRAMHTMLAIGD